MIENVPPETVILPEIVAVRVPYSADKNVVPPLMVRLPVKLNATECPNVKPEFCVMLKLLVPAPISKFCEILIVSSPPELLLTKVPFDPLMLRFPPIVQESSKVLFVGAMKGNPRIINLSVAAEKLTAQWLAIVSVAVAAVIFIP